MTTDVYSQFFSARCAFNGVERRASLVALTADSEQGNIKYTASATFFPHNDETDFAISYDAYVSTTVYDGKGRRSKKREAELLENFRETIDTISRQIDASIDWTSPLREARRG